MKIRMTAGLSGPTMSLAPGDTKVFDDADEAQRLIDAGFAELVPDEDAPAAETTFDRVARLQEELAAAEAALDAEDALSQLGPAATPAAAPLPAKAPAAKSAKPKA